MAEIREMAGQFIEILNESQLSVILTGAGVSTHSGIPDFRGPTGLYSKISPKTFQLDTFLTNPGEYYKTAIEHIHPLADKEPNITHIMLAKLQEKGLIHTIITQNINGLHQKAGSDPVIEFHGSVRDFYCISCKRTYVISEIDEKIRKNGVPHCDICAQLIRPGVVFFDDPIPHDALFTSQDLAEQSDVFIAMGSSLEVYPAASLPQIAFQTDSKLIIINKGSTKMDPYSDLLFDVNLKDFSTAVMELI